MTRNNKAEIDLRSMQPNASDWEKKFYFARILLRDSNFYIRSAYFILSILGLFNFVFIALLLFDIFF
jgi:hypothetical protein